MSEVTSEARNWQFARSLLPPASYRCRARQLLREVLGDLIPSFPNAAAEAL